VRGKFASAAATALENYDPAQPPSSVLVQAITDQLNLLLDDTALYAQALTAGIPLSLELQKLASQSPTPQERQKLNRLVFEQAFGADLADCAIATPDAQVSLSRTTVLGPVFTHRLSSSDCTLNDFASAEDAQSGCIRFSAYASGSRIHQPYECVEIERHAPLFTSRRFGQPGYAQLALNADRQVLSGPPSPSIRAGAQDGSEMGAFCRDKNPIKERGLRLKLDEFMPVGLTPVLVYVT
jgi:hypothetical protein